MKKDDKIKKVRNETIKETAAHIAIAIYNDKTIPSEYRIPIFFKILKTYGIDVVMGTDGKVYMGKGADGIYEQRRND